MDWGSCLTGNPGGPQDVATIGCVSVIIQNIINAALVLAGVVALIFIVWSGIQLIMSRGDQERIASAKKTLTFAIIGLVFLLLSFALFNFVLSELGISQDSVGIQQSSATGGSCPDGSGTYSCGVTSDTQCPLCSASAKCDTGVYSIASCSGSAQCESDSDCKGTCPAGQTTTTYCNKQPLQQLGTCVTNCH